MLANKQDDAFSHPHHLPPYPSCSSLTQTLRFLSHAPHNENLSPHSSACLIHCLHHALHPSDASLLVQFVVVSMYVTNLALSLFFADSFLLAFYGTLFGLSPVFLFLSSPLFAVLPIPSRLASSSSTAQHSTAQHSINSRSHHFWPF